MRFTKRKIENKLLQQIIGDALPAGYISKHEFEELIFINLWLLVNSKDC